MCLEEYVEGLYHEEYRVSALFLFNKANAIREPEIIVVLFQSN
jgi:hypothetical protein